jgi:alkylation response protein AidB-like acyl-CoA dehydrogenase
VTLCSCGIIDALLTDVRRWAQDTKLADGRRVIDQEWVQQNLATVHAKLEFLKLINWKVAWTATQGGLDVADASTTKVFGTEFYLEAFRLMGEILGERTYLADGTDAVLRGRIERLYRSLVILTFGGGVNEVQRDLIAMFGLGMPRSLR